MTDTAATPESDYTAEQCFESCNGFDEIAIKQKFGVDPSHLAKASPTQFLRAMVFVEQRRKGMSDAEAYQHAQTLPLAGAYAYFHEEPDNGDAIDGTGPTTDAGKG